MTPDYLELALDDGRRLQDMTLTHRSAGDLHLTSGRLIACDPFVFPEMEPFAIRLPLGSFPVILSIAEFSDDQRVAFATVRFRQSKPIVWDMLTVGDQSLLTLKPDEIFGYPVDAGTGCFMDLNAGKMLTEIMNKDHRFYETLIAEMDKTYRHTWSWLNMKLDGANLVAFSSGCGDGFYASYAGFDADGEVAVVLTDFGVVPSDNNPNSPDTPAV
jgi:hypothetical protein